MHPIATSQDFFPSEQRRRHLREKASSIVYLKLEDDNGGILLDLGTGGLSLQAVAGLNLGQDLVLHFGLFEEEKTITIEGRVAWLGPTRKVAGICFQDVSDSTMQSIASWIAREKAGSRASERKAASPVKPVPAESEIPFSPPQVSTTSFPSNETAMDPQASSSTRLPSDLLLGVTRPGFTSRKPSAPLPPPQVSTASNPPGETAMDSHPSSSTPLPSDLLLGVTRPGLTSRKPSAPLAFGVRSPSPIPMNDLHPKEHSAASTVSPTEVPLEPLQPILALKPTSPSGATTEFLSGDRAPSDSPIPISLTVATSKPKWISSIGEKWIQSMLMMLSSLRGKWRLQVVIAAGLAACLGIFVLILIVTNYGNHPENPGSSAASASALLAVSPRATADVSPAVGTALQSGERQNPSQPQTLPVPATQSGSMSSSDPIPAPPQIARQPTETSWLRTLKKTLLGVDEVDDESTLDPAIASVPVWADQRSGFYYCTSSPYFVKPLRVSLVTQGEALQSGFQPKLGSYCQ